MLEALLLLDSRPARVSSAAPAGLEGAASFLCILAYVSFFALGCGPIPWVYLSEILPEEIKGNAQVGGRGLRGML